MEFWELEEHEVAYSWLRADVPGGFCEDVPGDLGFGGTCPALPGTRPDPPEES